jgi:hypothetical protein
VRRQSAEHPSTDRSILQPTKMQFWRRGVLAMRLSKLRLSSSALIGAALFTLMFHVRVLLPSVMLASSNNACLNGGKLPAALCEWSVSTCILCMHRGARCRWLALQADAVQPRDKHLILITLTHGLSAGHDQVGAAVRACDCEAHSARDPQAAAGARQSPPGHQHLIG